MHHSALMRLFWPALCLRGSCLSRQGRCSEPSAVSAPSGGRSVPRQPVTPSRQPGTLPPPHPGSLALLRGPKGSPCGRQEQARGLHSPAACSDLCWEHLVARSSQPRLAYCCWSGISASICLLQSLLNPSSALVSPGMSHAGSWELQCPGGGTYSQTELRLRDSLGGL